MFLKPEPGLGRRGPRERQLTLRNYELVPGGTSTVAGRAAELWELRPRHEGRSSYAVAVDSERRLLLSLEARRGGEIVFSTGFEEISFEPASPAPERPGGRRGPRWLKVDREAAAPERLSSEAGFPVWLPSWLPPGFELRESEVLRMKPGLTEEQIEAVRKLSPVPLPRLEGAVAKVSYTDGLAFLACVQVPAASEAWRFVQKFIPPGAPEAPAGKVVARKFPDRGGAAYLLELGESVVFVAGNAAPAEMESMIRTFERR
jgi:negative regulator of sigma E activity